MIAFLVSQASTTATNMLLLHRHINAAYMHMGTAIVQTSKWLTQLKLHAGVAVCIIMQLTSRSHLHVRIV